jgi:hypothetical protein
MGCRGSIDTKSVFHEPGVFSYDNEPILIHLAEQSILLTPVQNRLLKAPINEPGPNNTLCAGSKVQGIHQRRPGEAIKRQGFYQACVPYHGWRVQRIAN